MPSTKCGSTQMGAVVRMAAELPPRATPAPCTQPCEEVLGQGSRAAHRSHRVIREREKLPHFSRKPLGRSGDSHLMQSINLHPHQQAAFQLQCPHAQLPTPFPAISLYCVLSLSPQPGASPPPSPFAPSHGDTSRQPFFSPMLPMTPLPMVTPVGSGAVRSLGQPGCSPHGGGTGDAWESTGSRKEACAEQ